MTNRSKLHESIVSILFEILKGEDMNPSHFIHEIKTKGYNVIGILPVPLLHLWDSTQKPDNSAHPILLQSFKSMNTVHYLWVTIWPNVVDFYELSKMLTIFPTAWKKNPVLAFNLQSVATKVVYLISCFKNCTIFGISAKMNINFVYFNIHQWIMWGVYCS